MPQVNLGGRIVELADGQLVYVEPALLEPGGIELKEDLLQVNFGHNLILDVGWYGDEQQGCFRVVVIRDGAWEHPVLSETHADFPDTLDAVERAARWLTSDLRRD